jgi:Transport and Golgi organisation 2
MCTVILLHRPGHAWPVLVAANRDERLDRAWDPPAAWWPDRPGVVGGRDRSAGGTWMAVNRAGVVATGLNRPGSLGPAAGKRSRGDLPLLALDAATATAAATRILRLPAGEWRPFNMVLADRTGGIFLRATGQGGAEALPLPPGLSMVTAHDPNDPASPRTARHLPRFRAAAEPDPDQADWASWEALLGDGGWDASLAETLAVPPTNGFGTVSSSLLALGADGQVIWRFAAGPAGQAPFQPVALA